MFLFFTRTIQLKFTSMLSINIINTITFQTNWTWQKNLASRFSTTHSFFAVEDLLRNEGLLIWNWYRKCLFAFRAKCSNFNGANGADQNELHKDVWVCNITLDRHSAQPEPTCYWRALQWEWYSSVVCTTRNCSNTTTQQGTSTL